MDRWALCQSCNEYSRHARSFIMKKYLYLTILLLCSSPAFAYVTDVTGCPADSAVMLGFYIYSNTASGTYYVGTSDEERIFVPGAAGTTYTLYFPAHSNSSGVVKVRTSNLALVISSGAASCVANVPSVGIDPQTISLLIGSFCGIAFALAVGTKI